MRALVPAVLLVSRDRESFSAIFFLQKPGVVEGDFHVHSFEGRRAEREDVAFLDMLALRGRGKRRGLRVPGSGAGLCT